MSDRLSPPVNLEQVNLLIQTAQWFSSLGTESGSDETFIWVDAEVWKHHISFATAAEFGIATKEGASPLAELAWLPTSADQDDPIHKGTLAHAIMVQGRVSELKAAQIQVSRLTLVSLRSVSDSVPLLIVGRMNLIDAAKGAAVFACRMAVTELVAGKPGFWCRMLPIYHAGHWPFGTSTSGQLKLFIL